MSLIYCSLPVSMRDRSDLIDSIKNKLKDFASSSPIIKSLKFDHWRQGKIYNNKCIEECDVFLFMHPENKFEFLRSELPSGVKREYEQAIDHKKEIFLLYKTKDGNLCPFRVFEFGHKIKGIPGSTGELFSWLLNNQPDSMFQKKHVAQIGKQGNSSDYPLIDRIYSEKMKAGIDPIVTPYDRRLLIE